MGKMCSGGSQPLAFLAPFIPAVVGFFASAAPIAATVAAGTSVYHSFTASNGKTATGSVIGTATPPASFATVQAEEAKRLLKAQQATTKTILTSPLGVADPSQTKRKLLLGA